MSWPSVELDPVRRLRILAAARGHVAFGETLIAAPFERVWAVAGDLENGVPRFEWAVTRARILERRGDRLRMRSELFGLRLEFDVELRPGWCLMRSRLGEVGMAAAPEGPDRTRFAHFEGSRLGRLARPLLARGVAGDLSRLRALLEAD